MKKAIAEINLGKLKNETHTQFGESVNSLIEFLGAEALQVATLYALFKAAFDKEKEALDYMRKSHISSAIIDQDHVRDITVRGFTDTIKGLRNHYDALLRSDANRLWTIFSFYGNLAQKPLDDETAAINDLIYELKSNCGQELERLGLEGWVDQLNTANWKFHSLMMDRYGAETAKTAYRMKTIRTETDTYYRAIVNEFENIVLKGTATSVITQFIAELNAIVTRFRNILAQDTGKEKKKEQAATENPPADVNKPADPDGGTPGIENPPPRG